MNGLAIWVFLFSFFLKRAVFFIKQGILLAISHMEPYNKREAYSYHMVFVYHSGKIAKKALERKGAKHEQIADYDAQQSPNGGGGAL